MKRTILSRAAVVMAVVLGIVASAVFAQAGPGYSLGFTTASGSSVTVPHNTALNVYPITVTAWVRTSHNDGAYRGIVQKTSTNPTNGFAMTVRNGELFAAYARSWTSSVLDGTNALSGGYIADGQWHHVALVVDAAGGRVYRDGVLQNSHGWNGTPQSCTPGGPLVLGRYSGYTLEGTVDEVTLWNVAKTEGEIQAMMHQTLTGSEANLVGYWRLDEGIGTSTANSSSGGSIFNGTLNNAPAWTASTAPIGLPVVVTLGASGVGMGSATLNGSVLPNYQDTTVFFQYGLTTAYGANTGNSVVGAANGAAVPVASSIGGLESGRTYHYRLVAANSAGTVYGEDASFSTPASTDARLSSLTMNSAALVPAFNPDTLNYFCNVPNTSDQVQVLPICSEAHASIQVRVNGGAFAPIASGTWSAWLQVNVGPNPIDVQVTAQDGTSVRTYTITVNRVPSANANLAGLILSTGTLSPVFSPGTANYSASVANEATSVYVTPTAADFTATIRVRVNGESYRVVTSGLSSPILPLNVGNNTIDVQVTAQDGTTVRTYTIAVSRAPSSNAYLSNLTISAGTLAPAFDSARTDYTVSVANNVMSMGVTPTAAEANATIRVRANGGAFVPVGSGALSPFMSLSLGTNTIDVQVTAQNGTTVRNYSIQVTRVPSTNANLAFLTISAGTLSPAFSTAITNYTVIVSGTLVSTVTVTPTVSDPTATVLVRINTNSFIWVDSNTPSSPLDLNLGTNTIYIRVNAQDPSVRREYTIGVIREPSTNAALASLSISPGDLAPAFSPEITNYNATVASNINFVLVYPGLAESVASAHVRVNGGAYVPLPSTGGGIMCSLVVRSNVIDVKVTAQDTVTVRIYTLAVYREPSGNANLEWLQVETPSGTKYLDPVFTPQNTNYTCRLTGTDEWFRVKATADDTKATLRLLRDGVDLAALTSDVPGPYLSMAAGDLPVSVRVTAENGTVRTYDVLLHRPSTDAYLSSLLLSAGTLSPPFQKLTYKYSATVPYSVSNVVLTPTAEHPLAYVSVSIGTNPYVRVISGQPSQPLPLVVGTNSIAVYVRSEDGFTHHWYDLLMARAPSTNARLANLVLSQGELTPLFSPTTTNYSVITEVASLTITPYAEDPTASIQLRVNGGPFNPVSSGLPSPDLPLRPGVNSIDVRVTAMNGTTVMEYHVAVSRSGSPWATTLPVTQVTAAGSASLLGMVTPNGLPTVGWFEWRGVEGAAGTTPPQTAGSGFGVACLNDQVSGLNLSRPVFVRAVASNQLGVVYGAEQMAAVPRQLRGWALDTFYTNFPAGLTQPTAIAAGVSHALALDATGRVTGWGSAPAFVTTPPPVVSNVIAIAAGGKIAWPGSEFSLALNAAGLVNAWGTNYYGQLNVPTGLSNVVGIAAGYYFSLALKSDGTVVGWGGGSSGGGAVPRGLSNVVSIAAGDSHSLALKNDGSVVSWGSSSYVPPGLGDVVALAGGYNFSLALKKDSTVIAWGSNSDGQTNVPAGLSNVIAVAAGHGHAVALKQDGTLVGWGSDIGGAATLPTTRQFLASAITAGQRSTLCLVTDNAPAVDPVSRADGIDLDQMITLTGSDPDGDPIVFRITTLPQTGALYQWSNGARGTVISQPGTLVEDPGGRVVFAPPPGQAGALLDSFQYAADDGQLVSAPAVVSLSVIAGGAPHCTTRDPGANTGLAATLCGMVTPNYYPTTAWFEWGTNQLYGNSTAATALGSGNTATAFRQQLTGLVPGRVYHYRIVAGNSRGTNYGFDQILAVGTRVRPLYQEAMEPPSDLGTVAVLAGSSDYTLALRTDGTVAAWGYATSGTLSVPAGLTNVATLRAANQAAFAILNDGRVASWGSAPLTDFTGSLSNVVDIAGGYNHLLALSADGRVSVLATYGETNLLIPAGLSNVVQVAAGYDYSLALRDDGTVVGWGGNFSGQASVPVGLSNVVSIAAYGVNSIALRRDGTVVVWGANQSGQTNVPPGLTDVRAVASRGGRSVALLADYTILDWGSYLSPGNSLSNVVAIASGGPGAALIADPIAVVAPRLTRCEWSGTGTLHLTATGSAGTVYQVWASTNLGHWTLLGPAAETAPGLFEYTDSSASTVPRRFYQLRWP